MNWLGTLSNLIVGCSFLFSFLLLVGYRPQWQTAKRLPKISSIFLNNQRHMINFSAKCGTTQKVMTYVCTI